MERSAEERLRAHGLETPVGHTLVSLAERPDLIDPSDHFNGDDQNVWMVHDLG